MEKEDYQTTVKILIAVNESLTEELNVNELTITESLLSPTVYASIKIEETLAPQNWRNLDNYYAKPVIIQVSDPKFQNLKFNNTRITSDLIATLVIFRLSKRQRKNNYSTETFELSACSPTLITDAKSWVPDHWVSKTPSEIVENIYTNVFNLAKDNFEIESSNPVIDFAGERLHPFQIITQMAERAITNDGLNDPSFLHYMTLRKSNLENSLVHNFKSLNSLSNKQPINKDNPFSYSMKNLSNLNYYNPFDIMTFSFPCDFDLLSDIMNGYDEGGNKIFSLTTIDPYDGTGSVFRESNSKSSSKYTIAPFSSITNLKTSYKLDSNPTNVEAFLLKRKARMALLEQDKIALKMTIPFNPLLSVGNIIYVSLKKDSLYPALYGSGNYMIVNMTHQIKPKGLSVTNLDCVAKTVGRGVL